MLLAWRSHHAPGKPGAALHLQPTADDDAVLLVVVDVQACHLRVRGFLIGFEFGRGLRVGCEVGISRRAASTAEIRAIAMR